MEQGKKTIINNKSTMKLVVQGQPIINEYISNKIGRPVEYTPEIGEFICFHVSLGYTMDKLCDKYNELIGHKILHKVKIYYWLKNDKLKDFRKAFYYAREIAAQGILDSIIQSEENVENLTLDSKAGRVVLESLRWRAKVQNPDYFNPVQKSQSQVDHTFVIRTEIPEPKLVDLKMVTEPDD
jgi:hypothetical protein